MNAPETVHTTCCYRYCVHSGLATCTLTITIKLKPCCLMFTLNYESGITLWSNININKKSRLLRWIRLLSLCIDYSLHLMISNSCLIDDATTTIYKHSLWYYNYYINFDFTTTIVANLLYPAINFLIVIQKSLCSLYCYRTTCNYCPIDENDHHPSWVTTFIALMSCQGTS